MPDREELETNSARGRTAQLLYAELKITIAEREAAIIQKLVRNYIDGCLDEATMRGGIAGIAELRSLLDGVQREVRLGLESLEELMQEKDD